MGVIGFDLALMDEAISWESSSINLHETSSYRPPAFLD